MINKNMFPLWFIFIWMYPAMKALSNKSLISSQFKTVSESNPLASCMFLILSQFQESAWNCTNAVSTQE